MELLNDYELDSFELEGDGENEWSALEDGEDFDGELEDEFLGDAWKWLTKPKSTQRRVALNAAKATLSGGGGALGGLAGAPLGPWGSAAGAALGSTLGGIASGALPDQELMEHLAALAEASESEAEAEAFIGALIPAATRLIPKLAPVVRRVAPQLIRGAVRAARVLRQNPGTRPLVRALPTSVQRTVRDLGRITKAGKPVTPRTASRCLARNTYRVLANPQLRAQAAQRAKVLNRRYQQRLAEY